jgi:hypothetical protein
MLLDFGFDSGHLLLQPFDPVLQVFQTHFFGFQLAVLTRKPSQGVASSEFTQTARYLFHLFSPALVETNVGLCAIEAAAPSGKLSPGRLSIEETFRGRPRYHPIGRALPVQGALMRNGHRYFGMPWSVSEHLGRCLRCFALFFQIGDLPSE